MPGIGKKEVKKPRVCAILGSIFFVLRHVLFLYGLFGAARTRIFAIFELLRQRFLQFLPGRNIGIYGVFVKCVMSRALPKKKAKKHVNFSVFGHHVDVGKNLANSIVFSRWVQKHCK